MTGAAPNPFSGEAIDGALSRADAMSRREGDALVAELPDWDATLDSLFEDRCPKTYVGVLAITLVARMLSPTVNVAKIKKGDDPDAYSAPSVGKKLIPFVKNQGISLRTTSTQIMNSQPFTYKPEITPDLTNHVAYPTLYAAVQRVQQLTSSEAERVLALTFHRGRQVHGITGGLGLAVSGDEWHFAETVLPAIAEFVDTHSEGGKSGQALAAAAFDCLFGADAVRMKKINDPSFSSPGDATIGEPVWMSVEVKQVTVTTGTLEAFADDCLAANIYRAVYLALDNARYPQNIDRARLERRYGNRMQFDILTSSNEVTRLVLAHSAGSPAEQVKNLASALLARISEIGCSSATQNEYVSMLVGLGFTHVHTVEVDEP